MDDNELFQRGIYDLQSYQMGVQEHKAGKTLKDNPFRGTHARYCWIAGWQDADKGGKEKEYE